MNKIIYPQIISVSEKVSSLVAKFNREKSEWLPLWIHSIDTCGVAELLLKEWLPVQAQKAMADSLSDEDIVRVIRAAAILHDYGKATAAFQTKISSDCEILQLRLNESGLQLLSRQDLALLQHRNFSHASAGEALLIMAGASLSFSEIVGAHHGVPWSEGSRLFHELEQERERWTDPRSIALWGKHQQSENWHIVQKEYFIWMEKVADCSPVSALPALSSINAVLLTGLIIMADWIASNEAYFPLIPLDVLEPENLSDRIEKGWKALGLPPPWMPCITTDLFQMSKEQFGFAPNAVQLAMMLAVKNSVQPGLMILEAPMGLGKTEAALLTANILANTGTGGIFFGLPTQATANAIFNRIVDWGEKQPVSNKISIRLAHGMSELNETYQSLMSGNSISAVEEDGDHERLTVHEWFRGQKQALLADFVAGTVDQVLMSALQQKHVMLRHLGLCGKTVIIDECHAYDAYMNQYLEMALRWLGNYHTPVILLSATLPAKKRADFLAAYLNKSDRSRKRLVNEPWYHSKAYPVLTWTDGYDINQQSLPYDGQEQSVIMTKVAHDDTVKNQAEVTAAILTDALKYGGCAAVVLNTVRRAQYFTAMLKEKMSDTTVLLLHSRFIIPDRLSHEAELLKRMGKKSMHSDRNRVVVVGTQVIEQSLDFDADVMVSDLCPMDLLLQRIGRLHRHKVHDSIRPPSLQNPQCYVLCTNSKPENGAKAIYGEYLLMRTRALLPDTIRLPYDISRLVNEVYDEDFPLSETPEGYEQAKEADRIKESKLKQDAVSFRIHDPEDDYCRLMETTVPSDDEHARAQVRAGDMSLDALLLMRMPSGELSLLPWLQNGEKWAVDRCPSAEDARKLLAQRISLTAGLLHALESTISFEELLCSLSIPELWKESVWLQHMHLLVLDDQLHAKLGNLILSYNEQTGLKWEKEGERT